ncbi:MAG: phosphatase PAP2 family protein [Spirochaetaceae bacterium]|jgi:membrane-associated phospholipid phosphatase|nr:phosphatase PAP2 family protein [Spirochaetaceae bacterium]
MMKRLIISSSVVTAALLVIAAFFDLQIDEYIYNPESRFAKIFAFAGMLPQYALMIFPPAMIIAAMFENRRKTKALSWVLAVAALLAVTSLHFYEIANYVRHETGLSNITLILTLLCLLEIALFFAALPFAKKNPAGLLVTGLVGFIAFTFGYEILQLLKTYWGRQRFFTMKDAAEQFTQWYIPQGKAASDSFKSFPSGHSFAAMCAVWFALWPLFIDCLKKYTKLIFTLALLFAFTVMVSRMIYGRHFLSDVTAGAALALASFALAKIIICGIFKKDLESR